MKTYISYGGGVNSTAMIIHMDNKDIDYDEIIFADTGCEWPETYEYIEYFEEEYLSQQITRVTSQEMGIRDFSSLLKFFQHYSCIPSRVRRGCTVEFKVKPIYEYYQYPCVQCIGIDAGEAHRAKPARRKGLTNEFPLIDAGIDRQKCREIIQSAGLCVPRKSGCYFCPFARISQFKELYKIHPELFQIVLDLEAAHEKAHDSGYHIKKTPMRDLAKRFSEEQKKEELQLELFDDPQVELFDDPQGSMNCLCKFA